MPQEKQRLAAAYGAALVDMEAAAVARLAAMRGIPFLASRASATASTSACPIFNRFIRPRRQLPVGPICPFCAFPAIVLARTAAHGRE